MSNGKRKLSLIGKLSENRRLSESHGEDAGPDLDQEMEKVFQMDGDKFNLSRISESPDATSPSRRAPVEDVSHHRIKAYPHMHTSLKPLHGRSSRRLVSPRPSVSEEIEPADAVTEKNATETESTKAHGIVAEGSDDDKDTNVGSGSGSGGVTSGSECEASVSERAAAYHESPSLSDPFRRVQFQIGDIPEDSTLNGNETSKDASSPEKPAESEIRNLKEDRRGSKEEEKRKRKHRHYHHHYHSSSRHRKFSLQDEIISRKRAGSAEVQRRPSVRPDEASFLDEVDIENLESRRFDDLRRYPKLPIRSSNVSVIHIGREGGEHIHISPDKKLIDHSPHAVFVQLDELCGAGEEREWKETARWIKYEEDVEEGADRWGQPHVASLSFHSLLNLRRCLETGVVLLDLDEKDLPGVSYRIVEQMVIDELIDENDRATVLRALLLRHRHVNDHDRFRFPMRRNFSSYTSLQNLQNYGKQPRIVASVASDMAVVSGKKTSNGDSPHHTVEIKEEQTYLSSSEDIRKNTKESILKKIPLGAEATTVLVGAVDFLEQPTIAFVRLAEGVLMPSITEVSIPVRFIFVLLGPPQADLDYHEIGRSISTLMSNAQFHNIAYKASDRKDLLSAINEFLDDSIVLPPGDWERKALLPFSELKAKSDAIRRRKNKRLNKGLSEQPEDSTKLLLTGGDEKKPPFDDPLRRTKRPFGGLINDLKRRYPHYVSDFVDGFNLQCIAAAIFMYFAALSGAITFGGLMGDKTRNLIGISETLIATSLGGVFFALFSGQPLVIVGSTGPLLLFDESLFGFCEFNGIDYLKMRVYIGIWLTVIAIIVVGLEGSVFVKMFTRFTEEIFAALISLLYIFESFQKLVLLYYRHPLLSLETYCDTSNGAVSAFTESSSTPIYTLDYVDDSANATFNNSAQNLYQHEEGPKNQPNTALFCTILAFGTFFIAYYLRQFRNSKFLGRSARRALGDFGVPLAIIIMVLLDYFTPNTYTEKLQVPEGLEPSNSNVRGWIIQPQGLETWVAFAAGVPAVLVYILLFMETHITELIIDKKERKLRKGSGFHVDIVLLCIANAGCGLIGAPWVCAATVRSIAHVSALTVMSQTHAPGDKPHIVEVKEQRLSALLVALFIGLSVLMSVLLRLVPMAVLFGVFLYMGVSSTNGIQFFERLTLIFMPVKHHSQASYVRRVKTFKMHLFTVIQLMCLVVLWIVKSTAISLAFPFFLILMVPLRAQLRYLFTPEELRALDSDEIEMDADDPEEEPDFYTEAPLPG